ncbi:hypothetical protein C1I89_31145 [Achromobacter pulmonis]|uniref:Potassium channel domain-containing protein n=1 Tax=Achromobacter pulmonis TaxID=1389932 RepID=A0A2N8K9P0_9BURK|nr:potassium channel family protein [Achromobacter pulmonis]PND30170.1 hypothetical protein C1I89_31145 [Achromobacter pulmonis]
MHPSAADLRRLAFRLLFLFSAVVLLYALLYGLLTKFAPGNGVEFKDQIPHWTDFIYFSIVTVSTLGYGDLAPVGWSRALAASEALFGLLFVGYSISQVVSAKQGALIDYLAKDRIVQTYDECLRYVTDAKELIGDRRRSIQSQIPVQPIDFIYNRSNPFYPALRAMEILNGYTAHVEDIGRAAALSVQVERAAHHVEEMASFVRKYINLLISTKANWKVRRTQQILTQLCEEIDAFSTSYIVHTRYSQQEYKGGGFYADIVKNLTGDIRRKL